MKEKIKYTEGEIGNVKVIKDFLPSPDELILKSEAVKVTLSLTKSSVDFFKSQASKHHTPYQRIIKNILDDYASYHKKRRKVV